MRSVGTSPMQQRLPMMADDDEAEGSSPGAAWVDRAARRAIGALFERARRQAALQGTEVRLS